MMSSETEATSPEPEGLQFDHAEFKNAEVAEMVTCAACQQPVVDHYYEINGVIVCEPCRDRIEGQLGGGSGLLRFLKAIVLGTGAAIAGAVIYFAIMHFFHLEVALVSILCGYLVGKAVMKGSGGRGGWIYQILAVGLTYIAVGMAYTGEIAANGGFDPKAFVPPGQPIPNEATLAILRIVLGVTYVFATPVLFGKENFLSLVIILFALWEAWKFTKRTKILVTGPYRVGDTGPSLESEGVADHA